MIKLKLKKGLKLVGLMVGVATLSSCTTGGGFYTWKRSDLSYGPRASEVYYVGSNYAADGARYNYYASEPYRYGWGRYYYYNPAGWGGHKKHQKHRHHHHHVRHHHHHHHKGVHHHHKGVHHHHHHKKTHHHHAGSEH